MWDADDIGADVLLGEVSRQRRRPRRLRRCLRRIESKARKAQPCVHSINHSFIHSFNHLINVQDHLCHSRRLRRFRSSLRLLSLQGIRPTHSFPRLRFSSVFGSNNAKFNCLFAYLALSASTRVSPPPPLQDSSSTLLYSRYMLPVEPPWHGCPDQLGMMSLLASGLWSIHVQIATEPTSTARITECIGDVPGCERRRKYALRRERVAVFLSSFVKRRLCVPSRERALSKT